MELNPIFSMAAQVRMPYAEIPGLISQMLASPADADIFMSMSHLFMIVGNPDFAHEMQAKALERSVVYRLAGTREPSIRVLALMGAGDMAGNTPLDFLVENSDVRLDLLYVVPGRALPETIPDHDVAFVALGESSKHKPTLERMSGLVGRWPRPVLNLPERILHCSRDGAFRLLSSIPGLAIPSTVLAGRAELEQIARLGRHPGDLVGNGAAPVTVRPIDLHSGKGLSKVENADELAAYLDTAGEQDFFVSRYVEYRSPDGLYRKARIALIDGLPYICHLAISEHWIVHYVSASMAESAAKREEEAVFMRDFESGFALRHRAALSAVAERLGLDYVVIDCAETADGELLLFEVDNRAWVHATDPVDVFPYKQAAMGKVFGAFRALLLKSMNTRQS